MTIFICYCCFSTTPATPSFCLEESPPFFFFLPLISRHLFITGVRLLLSADGNIYSVVLFSQTKVDLHICICIKCNCLGLKYTKKEQEGGVHSTYQEFCTVCFDNIRAPSRFLCEVLLANLVLQHWTGNSEWQLQELGSRQTKTSLMTRECPSSWGCLHSPAGWLDFSQRSRILTWLPSQSWGESTGRADGNRNMMDNCASRGTIRNVFLILSNPLISWMKNELSFCDWLKHMVPPKVRSRCGGWNEIRDSPFQ